MTLQLWLKRASKDLLKREGFDMEVKNYYKFNLEELDQIISKMRLWLIEFQSHAERPRVMFALDVALEAKESYQKRQEDPFINLVLDNLCDL